MNGTQSFVDIHCHLLPEIDDGATTWDESLGMARMAVNDGIGTIIVTPHQLGAYAKNSGETIRNRTADLQQLLARHDVLLHVLPGADVRIEADLVAQIRSGNVVTLADQGRHVLLELPHEMYFPLEPVLDALHAAGMVGILSHPERNQGLLRQPQLIESLVQYGCLMQVTAGSLLGAFGSSCWQMAEQMVRKGLVHFVATDAHGVKSRRPLLRQSYERVASIVGEGRADRLYYQNPTRVVQGKEVPGTDDACHVRRSRRFQVKRAA